MLVVRDVIRDRSNRCPIEAALESIEWQIAFQHKRLRGVGVLNRVMKRLSKEDREALLLLLRV